MKNEVKIGETIYFEITDIENTVRERMNLDVSGHYNPDIFDFKVNRNRLN